MHSYRSHIPSFSNASREARNADFMWHLLTLKCWQLFKKILWTLMSQTKQIFGQLGLQAVDSSPWIASPWLNFPSSLGESLIFAGRGSLWDKLILPSQVFSPSPWVFYLLHSFFRKKPKFISHCLTYAPASDSRFQYLLDCSTCKSHGHFNIHIRAPPSSTPTLCQANIYLSFKTQLPPPTKLLFFLCFHGRIGGPFSTSS